MNKTRPSKQKELDDLLSVSELNIGNPKLINVMNASVRECVRGAYVCISIKLDKQVV